MFSILRPYIFSLDPEVAHDLAIKSLKVNILPKSFFKVENEEMLETSLLGNTNYCLLHRERKWIRAKFKRLV